MNQNNNNKAASFDFREIRLSGRMTDVTGRPGLPAQQPQSSAVDKDTPDPPPHGTFRNRRDIRREEHFGALARQTPNSPLDL